MTMDEQYMHRCLQLAALGAGSVAPNPMVGAMLVHQGRIIGQGYHQQYGQAHAEVNCLASVQEADRPLIPESTMYVSLEPCAHFGKTPPCADRLVSERVKRVVIACRDSFAQVDGKGIEKLKAAGIEVTVGVLEKEAMDLNRRFFTYHNFRRPYIVLKWAQTADGFIGRQNQRTAISNSFTNRMVHKWRSEEAAIMVGTQTALVDNPQLNIRFWTGKAPLRVLVDRKLRVPETYHLFDGLQPIILFNELKNDTQGVTEWVQIQPGSNQLAQMMEHLYDRGIQSVLVEGGKALLQSFIDLQLWDECRIIENTELNLKEGVSVPIIHQPVFEQEKLYIASDQITIVYSRQP